MAHSDWSNLVTHTAWLFREQMFAGTKAGLEPAVRDAQKLAQALRRTFFRSEGIGDSRHREEMAAV